MAAPANASDPRLSLPPDTDDVRPVVAIAASGPSTLMIGIGLAVAALLLFVVLDSRRRTLETPAIRSGAADRSAASTRDAPPLYVPPAPTPPPIAASTPPPIQPFVLPQPPGPPRVIYAPQPLPQPPVMQYPVQLPPPPVPQEAASPRGSNNPALVFDQSGPQGGDATPAAPGNPDIPRIAGADGTRAAASTARATATQLINRATTVPQGTLIPAVLETALDTTRAGFARAIVSRDVRGFDGTRVLIPRGSRLVGEYSGNIAPGQNRAIVTWTRLVRPDGVAIAISSPAADTLGRGGIRGRVNTHFLSRLGTAILQSALEVGVNLASRPANGSVVLGLPGSNLGGNVFGQNNQPQPTLTVKPGKSIAVFVARDLDFTGVGNPR